MSDSKTQTNEDNNDDSTTEKSYEAFFVPPIEEDRGHGVLVIPSRWGVTASVKNYCYELSDLGFSVMAPQVLKGPLPLEESTANSLLEAADPNLMVDAVTSSIHALRTYSLDSRRPVSIVGFGMGASLGIWASERMPESVNLCVAYYGTQDIDFEKTQSRYVLNFAEEDGLVTEDDANFCYSNLKLADVDVEINWFKAKEDFMEKELPNYDQDAAHTSWQNTLKVVQQVNSID